MEQSRYLPTVAKISRETVIRKSVAVMMVSAFLAGVAPAQDSVLGTTLGEHIEDVRAEFESLMRDADAKSTPIYFNTITLELNTVRKISGAGKVEIFVLEAGADYEEAYVTKMTIPISFSPDPDKPLRIRSDEVQPTDSIVAGMEVPDDYSNFSDIIAALAGDEIGVIPGQAVDWGIGTWLASEDELEAAGPFVAKFPSMVSAMQDVPSKAWICSPNFGTDVASENLIEYMKQASSWERKYLIPESPSLSWPGIIDSTEAPTLRLTRGSQDVTPGTVDFLNWMENLRER